MNKTLAIQLLEDDHNIVIDDGYTTDSEIQEIIDLLEIVLKDNDA